MEAGGRHGDLGPGVAPGVEAVAAQTSPLPFEDFYALEHRRLYGAMCLITGNRHDAEELMQEAFLKVWERWDRVRELDDPVGYLYRTAMNAFRMRYRRAKIAARRVARPVTRGDELDAFESRLELDRGLAALTPRQRAAVVLTDLLEFRSAEAADALHIRPSTVRKLAAQGRQRLRDVIGQSDV